MLEELRALLANPQSSIFLGLVSAVDTAEADHLLVTIKAIPEGHDMVATMAFSGVMELPKLKDIAVVVLAGDSKDHAFIVALLPRLQSNFIIPPRTIAGASVVRSRAGKKLNLSSDTRINIGKGGETEELEPLVLGLVLKEFMTTVLQKVETLADEVKKIATETKTVFDLMKTGPITIPGTGSGASATGMPTPGIIAQLTTSILAINNSATAANTVKSNLATARSDYLATADTNILSQIAFTERGEPE